VLMLARGDILPKYHTKMEMNVTISAGQWNKCQLFFYFWWLWVTLTHWIHMHSHHIFQGYQYHFWGKLKLPLLSDFPSYETLYL
jgi:hypothetical protein